MATFGPNHPLEKEFQQAYNELESTLRDSTLFEKNPEYVTALRVAAIPERIIQFRVVWEDDQGNLQVNNGFRVQFNSALGPYKGGLRFHPTVNLSILKFLGFEQVFKNALTGLSMGGGKGGADFDPKGKSDSEIRRFCTSFMRELYRHIGADTDVPAGDIGVGAREIGFLFGAYKAMRNQWQGVLTGKGLGWGGSLIRPEATGYGIVYYVGHMLRYLGKGTIEGKRVVISGSGNVAQFAALKCIELGATVVSLSDSKGSLTVRDGASFKAEDVRAIAALKLKHQPLSSLQIDESRFEYFEGVRPWNFVSNVDIALPCATQNELSRDDALALVDAGVYIVAEGSNMGCEQAAIDLFEEERKSAARFGVASSIWYAPGKASNCGGVAVSGLEMAQNSQRLSWTSEEVDEKLKGIMANVFEAGVSTAKEYVAMSEGELPSLVAGSNIAGFIKVAKAMLDHGDWWVSKS